MKMPWTALGLIFVLSIPAIAAAQEPPTLRAAAVPDSLTNDLSLQIALEREGFSPGVLDGKGGPKTTLAIREFQKAHGLAVTGQADSKTLAELKADPASALGAYTITASDLAMVGELPKGWVEKSKASRLPYPSLDEMLAEKFHCSRALLAALNAGENIASLKAGQNIMVPNLPAPAAISGVERLEVDLSGKTIRLIGSGDKTLGLLHCSVARLRENLPHGKTTVTGITNDPTYRFDPDKWPEVKGISQTLIIPAGPRNPVGMCWIGLGLKGYGIHGTPTPEMIGKTGSHGCIRLTNWDAVRLGKTVSVGTTVVFSGA